MIILFNSWLSKKKRSRKFRETFK